MNANELATQAMEQCDGDVLKATEYLEQTARKDVGVWKALTEGLLRNACYDACRGICRSERRIIWNSPNYSAGGNGERVKQHAETLMDWPLPGGMKLRDATKKDLLEASTFYQKQASKMAAISGWLGAIANKVKTKTVGETLTDEQLRKLRDDTAGSERDAA